VGGTFVVMVMIIIKVYDVFSMLILCTVLCT